MELILKVRELYAAWKLGDYLLTARLALEVAQMILATFSPDTPRPVFDAPQGSIEEQVERMLGECVAFQNEAALGVSKAGGLGIVLLPIVLNILQEAVKRWLLKG